MNTGPHRLEGSPAPVRGAPAAAFVLLATCLALSPPVRAQEAASLCIVARSPADGLGFRDVLAALDLEWRKARLALPSEVVQAPAAEACPVVANGPSALLLLTGTTAMLLGPGGVTLSLDLSAVSPADRGQDIARRIAGIFAVEVRQGRPLLVDPTRAPAADAVSAGPVQPASAAPAGYAWAAGRYAYQSGDDRHRFGTDLEGGVSLYGERLQAGVRVGFEPLQEAGRDPFPVRRTAVPVTLHLRGGGRVHPRVLLRGGLGIGVEWRRLEAQIPDRADAFRRSGVVPLVELEAEATFAPMRVLRVGVAGVLRGFLAGETFAWQGRDAYAPPRVGVGLVLRVGVVLPDREAP
jgi:hypothetical protein